jgi:hypothetical protein
MTGSGRMPVHEARELGTLPFGEAAAVVGGQGREIELNLNCSAGPHSFTRWGPLCCPPNSAARRTTVAIGEVDECLPMPAWRRPASVTSGCPFTA